MRIVIDADFDAAGNVLAQHVIHTEAVPWNYVIDPTNPGVQIPFATFLASLSGNPAKQAAAGYADVHKVKGRPVGETRWQLLKAVLVTAPANDPVKQLNLV